MKKLFCVIIFICIALSQISVDATKPASSSYNDVQKYEIRYTYEEQAYYLNGDQKGLLNDLYTMILKSVHSTQEEVKGRAVVSFIISKEGLIEPNSIMVRRNKDVPEDYLNAGIEAIKKLGKFEPGKMNGIPKKVWYNLPIIYPLPLDKIITSE